MTDSVQSVVARILSGQGVEGAIAPLVREPFEAREASVRAWIASGAHGTMEWLANTVEPRVAPWAHWPWAKSFLVVKLPYGLPLPAVRGSQPEIAGYARGRDYHYRMEGLLKRVQADLETTFPGVTSFRFCDDQHLPEVELAIQAGLGWRGRNTLLLTRLGSAFHLGGLLLSLEVPSSPSLHRDHCGTCTACVDACPTTALTPEGRIDAGLCLSHWNIEDRATAEGVPASAAYGEVYGCDLCQQVCPWNRRAMVENILPSAWPDSWEKWVDLCRPGGGFQSLFTKTPLRRAGRHKTLKVLLRNLWNVDPDLAQNLSRKVLETETHAPLREWIETTLAAREKAAENRP